MFDLPKFIAWDLETGGLNHRRCAPLSLAAVPSWDAPPLSVHILPEGDVDARAAQVNGYTPQLWRERGAVTLKQAMYQTQHWLSETLLMLPLSERRMPVMAAHNAGFDSLFLSEAQATTGIMLWSALHWECTQRRLQDARDFGLLPPGSNHLDDLGHLSGFWDREKRNAAHDALQDARCCGHGLRWLATLPSPSGIA